MQREVCSRVSWFPVGAILNRVIVNPYWVLILTKTVKL